MTLKSRVSSSSLSLSMKELDNAERTIFIYAAIGGNVEIGKFLIKKGVNIHAVDHGSGNALIYAGTYFIRIRA